MTRSPREASDTNVFLPKLVGVIIVPGRSNVLRSGALPQSGVYVRGIELLAGDDFPAVLAPYFGRPLTRGNKG